MPKAEETAPLTLPPGCRQLLLGIAPGWRATRGTLHPMGRRTDGGWRADGPPIPVSFGRNGFAPEAARPLAGAPPAKTEGDGRTPAGAFLLDTAFGPAHLPPDGCNWPWRRTTPHCYFVDDPDSADYNRWVTLPEGDDPKARWRSFETMRREDGTYDLGLVVRYNDPPVAGRGSAIFMHLWKKNGAPTAGCTAMARPDMERLLRWLDPDKAPVLLQLPREVIYLLPAGVPAPAAGTPAGTPGETPD